MNVQNYRHIKTVKDLDFFYYLFDVPEVLNVHTNESKKNIYFF